VEGRSGAERGDRREVLANRVVHGERQVRARHGDVDVEAEDELPARHGAELPLDALVALAVVQDALRGGERVDARTGEDPMPSATGPAPCGRGQRPRAVGDARRGPEDDLELGRRQLRPEAGVAAAALDHLARPGARSSVSGCRSISSSSIPTVNARSWANAAASASESSARGAPGLTRAPRFGRGPERIPRRPHADRDAARGLLAISDTWLLAGALAEEVGARRCSVLDVCTGSGALAVTAARRGAEAVTAVDVSRRAVLTTRLNARLNGVRVRAVRSDLFAALGDARFDVIVSNPPYVPAPSDALPTRGPARAWDAGRDGRVVIDRLIREAPAHLRPGGVLLMVHSDICGIDASLAGMRDAGSSPTSPRAGAAPRPADARPRPAPGGSRAARAGCPRRGRRRPARPGDRRLRAHLEPPVLARGAAAPTTRRGGRPQGRARRRSARRRRSGAADRPQRREAAVDHVHRVGVQCARCPQDHDVEMRLDAEVERRRHGGGGDGSTLPRLGVGRNSPRGHGGKPGRSARVQNQPTPTSRSGYGATRCPSRRRRNHAYP
jgi:release factor glutamine methyltransferase